jgi:hypothetical protein
MEKKGRWVSRRSSSTALTPNPPLGWATITHPFHPLTGQRFEVLKTRRVGGIDTLLLRHAERGSYAVAREWTDWSLTEPVLAPDGAARKLTCETLLTLAELVGELAERDARQLDEAGAIDHAQTS